MSGFGLLGEGKMAWTGDFLWQKIKVPGFCTHRGWQNRSKYRGQGHRQQVQRDAKNPNYPNKLGFCKFDQNLNHPSGGVGEAGVNIYVGLTHWAAQCLHQSSTNYGHVSALPH